ncbi:mannosyltransferase family protein [Microlunatus parietis]|uniref:Mannosyltransferase (PIG-V) n=1 Tax=Microlunatus parietis TaxID=682979 RepID=A0A7Y9IA99_9ACTN|nr:mannosyltransferase family protein [Microlunatus parietis]NYE72985.1 hypothetical protein [Microlunatus parietis]
MTTVAAAVRQRLVRIPEWVRFPVFAWLAARALIQGLGWIVVAVAGVPEHARPGPFGTFFNWDSGYFACILEAGYFGPACADGTTIERVAFFPGYPLLARGLGWLFGLGTVPLGDSGAAAGTFALWLVPALCSLGAGILVYRIAEHWHGTTVARRAVIFFLAGPYALFLVVSYSEALYLLGATAAWWCCLRRRYLLTAAFGMIATATRVSGLFLVPALIALYLVDVRRNPGSFRPHRLIMVAASGLGAALYLGWLWWRTGSLTVWFDAQRDGWNRITQWPWQTLRQQLIHVIAEPLPDWRVQSVLELIFAIGLCLAVILLLRRRDWPAALLAGLTALSLMTSNTYLSLARNTLTVFPLFILLASLTVSRPRVFRFWPIMIIGLLILIYNTIQFALGNWAD